MKPLVSVVVPVYNGVSFIHETMQSILAQTLTDFELLVSERYSTDGTWEALQRYADDPRVRLLRLDAEGPAPVNFRHVTSLATGEFIKAVCADDILYPDCLEVQVAELRAHPSAALAVSSRDVIDASGKMVMRNRGLAGLSGEVTATDAIRRTVLAGTNIFGEPPTALFRRDALEEAGGWEPDRPFLFDLATYCSVLLHHQANLIAEPRPLWAFRLSGVQETVRTYNHSQTDHVVGFYRELAAANPGLLTPRHLLIGNARARVNTLGRHAVYRWLARGKRLSAAPAGSQSDAGKMP